MLLSGLVKDNLFVAGLQNLPDFVVGHGAAGVDTVALHGAHGAADQRSQVELDAAAAQVDVGVVTKHGGDFVLKGVHGLLGGGLADEGLDAVSVIIDAGLGN